MAVYASQGTEVNSTDQTDADGAVKTEWTPDAETILAYYGVLSDGVGGTHVSPTRSVTDSGVRLSNQYSFDSSLGIEAIAETTVPFEAHTVDRMSYSFLDRGTQSAEHRLSDDYNLAQIGAYLDEPVDLVHSFDQERTFWPMTAIPTAYFRRVAGHVYNQDGELVENALYVAALGELPTLGRVNENSYYSIYLLRVDYSDLILLEAAQDGNDYDFVRYELDEKQTDLDTSTAFTDLYFDTTTRQPLYMGHDVDIGGGMQ